VEQLEPGLWGFVAVNGDVQIGWCLIDGGWYVEDIDENRLAGPFVNLNEAKRAGKVALAHLSGASNPGW
jgi:hypothetical protein